MPIKKFLVAVLLVYAFSSCSKPQPPQYVGYENFRVEKASLSNSILATNIKLYNPNRYNLQLKSASMDVYFNDKFLGHSSLDSLITLPAKDTAKFPLRMQASAKDILSNSAKLLLNPDVKIRITGNAKAGRSGIFVNVPINYEGVQRIDLTELIGYYNRQLRNGAVAP
ncbi:MAG TPA: LEA type 2 family protein [Flavisolibacter sp.]|nr:LEA type 2 family protein [Flavisolibacter sp.]